jgi:hypothetical protein
MAKREWVKGARQDKETRKQLNRVALDLEVDAQDLLHCILIDYLNRKPSGLKRIIKRGE